MPIAQSSCFLKSMYVELRNLVHLNLPINEKVTPKTLRCTSWKRKFLNLEPIPRCEIAIPYKFSNKCSTINTDCALPGLKYVLPLTVIVIMRLFLFPIFVLVIFAALCCVLPSFPNEVLRVVFYQFFLNQGTSFIW